MVSSIVRFNNSHCDPDILHQPQSPPNRSCRFLKRWQMKRIPSILNPENAEQEAVHDENDTGPGQGGDLLSFRIRDPGHFERESDGGEREGAICD